MLFHTTIIFIIKTNFTFEDCIHIISNNFLIMEKISINLYNYFNFFFEICSSLNNINYNHFSLSKSGNNMQISLHINS